MSHRPLEQKKRRRLAKLFRGTPPGYIDLVAWLRTQPGVNTAGDARMIIRAGAVRHESHTLGQEEIRFAPTSNYMGASMRLVGNPCVPSHLRDGLRIVVPKDV